MKWFRLYDEILDDPKMMALSAKEFQTWILLLCVASRGIGGKRGEIPTQNFCKNAVKLQQNCSNFAAIVQQIHGNSRVILPILKRFIELGLIKENGNSIQIVNWDKRQFQSDDILHRVKRFRESKRNVTVTASETETEAEAENTKTKNTKKEDKYISPMLGEFTNVKLSWGQRKKFENLIGKDSCSEMIESLSAHMASTGKVYENHYATLYSWAVRKGMVKRGNREIHKRPANLFLDSLTEKDESSGD